MQLLGTSAPRGEERKVFDSWRKRLLGWCQEKVSGPDGGGHRKGGSSQGPAGCWLRGESRKATAGLWKAAISTEELGTYLDKESL